MKKILRKGTLIGKNINFRAARRQPSGNSKLSKYVSFHNLSNHQYVAIRKRSDLAALISHILQRMFPASLVKETKFLQHVIDRNICPRRPF